jgi:hypothetical protein
MSAPIQLKVEIVIDGKSGPSVPLPEQPKMAT